MIAPPPVCPPAVTARSATLLVETPAPRGPIVGRVARMARLALAVAVSATACRGYQRYRAAPLDAGGSPARAAAYRARALDDARLTEFLHAAGASSVDSGWSPRQLALAALFQRADVAEARAAIAAARATERTAGLGPVPSVSGSVERASAVDEGKTSPWTVSLAAGLTIETGGKRSARAARARATTLAARLRLDATGWDAAQAAESAAVGLLAADEDVRDADAEAESERAVATLLRARYAEGRISLADLAQAESDVRSAVLGAVQARRARADAEAALARTLAVPVAALAAIRLRPYPVRGCSTLDGVRPDSLQAIALQRRFDVGVALADYAGAEADVRLEVARQYPDLTIGPGLAWDQGIRRWTLGVGTPGLPRARNRGPIAETLARRAVQAARVRVLQDSALAGIDAAVAGCRATSPEVAAADSLRQAVLSAVTVAEAAYARGETGRTEVALARLAQVRAERTLRQATQRRALAGVALETAVGAWLTGAPVVWPDLTRDPVPTDTSGGADR